MKAKKAVSLFETHLKYLKDLGVKYNRAQGYREGKPQANKIVPRIAFNLDRFEAIELPFSAYEWVQLCQREGQFYVGGCCGQMSVLQDKIEHIFRIDAGLVEIRKLAEIAATMIGHDGCDGTDPSPFAALPKKVSLAKAVKDWKRTLISWKKARKEGRKLIDVWKFLALLWHIVKDFYSPEQPHPEARRTNPKRSELDDAVSLLSNGLSTISWDGLFSNKENGPVTQSQANRLVLLARILPALKTLNDKIDDLAPPPIDGVALVLRDDPDHVLKNGYGLSIFGSEKEAEKLINLWAKQEEEYKGEPKRPRKASDFMIRKVIVTKTDGVKFV